MVVDIKKSYGPGLCTWGQCKNRGHRCPFGYCHDCCAERHSDNRQHEIPPPAGEYKPLPVKFLFEKEMK